MTSSNELRQNIGQTLFSTKRRNFINKGMISILDQGIFSGSNFLITLLLGRWMLPEEYGIFSVSFAIFLFFSGIYSAFILEPLSVFGPIEKENPENYWVSVIYLHFIVCALLAVCILLYSIFWNNSEVTAIRSLAVSFIFIESIYLVRWIYYAKIEPQMSLRIDIVFASLLLFGLFILKKVDLVSPSNFFYLYAICSLIIGIFFFLRHQERPRMQDLRQVLIKHVNYGKWIAAASVLQWFALQVYGILIAKNLSFSDTASFKAVQNFSKPFEEISTAITLLLIPWFSKQYSVHKSSSILKRTNLISLLTASVGLLYLIVLAIIGKDVIHWLYQGKYSSYSYLIPLVLCSPIILSLSRGAQIGIRVIQKTKYLLASYAVSSILTLVFSSLLINRLGLTGAALGLFIASAGFTITINLFFLISLKQLKTKELNEKQNEI